MEKNQTNNENMTMDNNSNAQVNTRMRATAELAERFDGLQAQVEASRKDESMGHRARIKLMDEYLSLMYSYDWTDEVFEENGKKGLKNVKGEVVVPAVYDDFCTFESYCQGSLPVGAEKDGRIGLVKRDGKGTPVTGFEYRYMERIPHTAVYAVWSIEDTKHFALMAGGKILSPFELEKYYLPCDGSVILEADDKCGLLAVEQGLVYIKPEYDDIYDNGIGDFFTFVKDGKKGRVTLEGHFVGDEDYEKMTDEEQCRLDEEGYVYAPDFD